MRKASDAAEVEQETQRYNVDLKWFDHNHRSLDEMIAARVADLEGPTQKGRRRKSAGPTTMADLAKIEGFINPLLPLSEAIFRLILVHENKPLPVTQISQELAEAGLGIQDSRLVNPEVIRRLIEADVHYGFKRAG